MTCMWWVSFWCMAAVSFGVLGEKGNRTLGCNLTSSRLPT